jgi:hypothetical protein
MINRSGYLIPGKLSRQLFPNPPESVKKYFPHLRRVRVITRPENFYRSSNPPPLISKTEGSERDGEIERVDPLGAFPLADRFTGPLGQRPWRF